MYLFRHIPKDFLLHQAKFYNKWEGEGWLSVSRDLGRPACPRFDGRQFPWGSPQFESFPDPKPQPGWPGLKLPGNRGYQYRRGFSAGKDSLKFLDEGCARNDIDGGKGLIQEENLGV